MYKQLIWLICLLYFNISLTILGCFDLDRSPPPSDCAVCSIKSCTEEVTVCKAHPDCTKRTECLESCPPGDANCRVDCSVGQRLTDAMIELDICRSRECMKECDSCGSSIFDSLGAACSNCIMNTSDSCAVTSECAKDAKCSRVMRKRLDCNDPYCAVNDGLSYDSERERYESELRDDVNRLLTETCASECGTGTNLSCLNSYSMPPKSELVSSKTLVEFEIMDIYGPGVPLLKSVNIEAWLDDDENNTLVAEEVQKGRYRITVPEMLTGSFRLQKDKYFPTHVYVGRPLFGNEFWRLSLFSNNLMHSFPYLTEHEIDLTTKGLIIVTVVDCAHNPTLGVEVTYTEETSEQGKDILRFAPNKKTFFDKDEPAITDVTGSIVFLNVPEGSGLVRVDSDFVSGPVSVLEVPVLAGRLSWVLAFPLERIQ